MEGGDLFWGGGNWVCHAGSTGLVDIVGFGFQISMNSRMKGGYRNINI